MEDTVIIIIIIAAVLGSVIVPLLFWGFLIKLFVNHVSKFEKEERMLNQLLNQYAQQQNNQGANMGKKQESLTTTEMNILSRMSNMNSHLNNMDSLRRQQYETRRDGMVGSVINAGFTNFNPSDFS